MESAGGRPSTGQSRIPAGIGQHRLRHAPQRLGAPLPADAPRRTTGRSHAPVFKVSFPGRIRIRLFVGTGLRATWAELLPQAAGRDSLRSEEHTSELQSLMRISYAVFCLKKKKTHTPSLCYNHYST